MPDLHFDVIPAASGKPGLPLGQILNITGRDIRAALDRHVDAHLVGGQVHKEALGTLAEEAADEVSESLRVDAFELAFRAWAAVRELQAYADPAKHPPGEVNVVRWGKCSIQAPQAVDVKLSVLGAELPVLRLTVDLRADFESLEFTICDAAIRKVTPGAARASVSLKVGDTTVVPERSTPELLFPHGVSFDPALPIGFPAPPPARG